MSPTILFFRSVRVAILADSFATALAVFETGAFLAGALITPLAVFAGAANFLVFAAVLIAIFFAVAM